MKALNDDSNTKLPIPHNAYLATAATIFTLAIILASSTTPVLASATGNTTTTTATSSSAVILSDEVISVEYAVVVRVIEIVDI